MIGYVPLRAHRRTIPVLSGRPRGIGATGNVVALDDSTFARALSAPVAVVDFWSPSCPHCVTYKPVFEAVASEVGPGALMASVNVDQAPRTSGSYGIQAIPATVFLVNGREAARMEGALGRETLMAEISRLSAGAPTSPAAEGSTVGLVIGGLAVAGLAAALLSR